MRSPEDVVAAMAAADVPASKIYTIRDIVADAQYAARDMIREIRLADGSGLKVPGNRAEAFGNARRIRWRRTRTRRAHR